MKKTLWFIFNSLLVVYFVSLTIYGAVYGLVKLGWVTEINPLIAYAMTPAAYAMKLGDSWQHPDFLAWIVLILIFLFFWWLPLISHVTTLTKRVEELEKERQS